MDTHLDNYYASLLDATTNPWDDNDVLLSNSDDDDIDDKRAAAAVPAKRDINEILDDLATQIDNSSISKLNISRTYLWEGTKRALSRKSFSPKNKVSVKFMDDIGNSEGAVDLGGPMREFFTLVIQWIVDSPMFCGQENHKFISCQSKYLEGNDYFLAGIVIAMSVVHGGPGPQCFAPQMFDALIYDLSKVIVSVEDIYDHELKSALQVLLNSASKEDAVGLMNDGNLMTILDLAGTLQPVQRLSDISRIVGSTARWFVFGRVQPALESFKKGLSTLGVLEALKANHDAFHPVFCKIHEEISSDTLTSLFVVKTNPVGSTKAITESLVLSRWNDYLQDIEEGEDSITLNDILFFATGCKTLPPRKISPIIEFLHELEAWGEQSRFPTANTCANTLRLPVVHASYETFKADMTFAIQNCRGFGCA